MLSSISRPALHFFVLLLVAGCLFFVGLGRPPLLEPDEGRNAEVAREMLASGDWITPHFNTLSYLDKPAVFFWLVAASFRVWGISEWAARFPSALMALATVLLTCILARRRFDGPTSLRAGIVLATSPLLLALARLVTFDVTLTFLVTVALGSFWWAESGQVRPAWLEPVMFGAAGLATITKGPVGFLLPLLSILSYQALRGRLQELKRLRWGRGTVVFLAVALPWFVAVSLRHPDFPRYALWEESLRRFTTGHTRRTGSIGYYVPVYLAGFFPWSLFLLFAAWNRLKRWRELREEAGKSTAFLLAWAGVVFVFFSISQSKLPAYFLPAAVPLSILMARTWAEVESRGAGRSPDWLTAGFACLLALGLLVALSSQISLFGATEARLTKKLHPSLVAALRPCLLYSGLILGALAVVGRNLARRARGGAPSAMTFVLLALTVPFLIVRWSMPLQRYFNLSSSRDLAESILMSPEKDLPLFGYYYFRTSLPFYLRRPVGLITTDASETTSNYVSEQWLRVRHGDGGRGLPSSKSQPGQILAAGGPPVLFDISEVRALSFRQPALILVRNTQVWELGVSFEQVDPLLSGWECSVWKVGGSGNR